MKVCAECGGTVAWDAIADYTGELITIYDNYECLNCCADNPELKEQQHED